MGKLLFFIPAGYFIKTRLNTKASWLFHGYAEYLLGILILMYARIEPLESLKIFILGYLAFISLYEIGYIFNDFISVRFEKDPRKRLEAWQPSNSTIIIWIAIRVAVFVFLSYYLEVLNSPGWWYFYGLLILSFAMHNMLQRKEFKIFTFISLACLRFYAPVFLFLNPFYLTLSLPAILLHYVFFRTITYIDSKGLLNIPGRNSLSFKTAFYLILLPVSALFYLFSEHAFSIWVNLYFLAFWGGLFIAAKLGIIPQLDLKTD